MESTSLSSLSTAASETPQSVHAKLAFKAEGVTIDQVAGATLEATWQTPRDELARRLLEKMQAISPQFFERLIIDVLVAMGYGGSRRALPKP